MLSLKTIGVSSSSHLYYAKYCVEKGEAQGVWVGQGSSSLGLLGKQVEANDMKALLRGFSPDGVPLCRNAGEKHRGGWDMTFSAPKSFSVIWAVADEALRDQLEEAVKEASLFGLEYMQREAAHSRVGQGGLQLVKSDLVASQFFHSSSRDGDPQAHCHMIVKNVALCGDGVWRTLQGRFFFDHKMAAGAAFKLKLAELTQTLGFKVIQGKDSFEVVGVSKELCESLSKRRQAIDQKLLEMGYTRETASQEMLEMVTLETRGSKAGHVESRRDLLRWRKDIADKGFTIKDVYRLRKKRTVRVSLSQKGREKIYSELLDALVLEQSVFSKTQLHNAIFEAFVGKIGSSDLENVLQDIYSHKNFMELGADKFTTREMYHLERDIVRGVYIRENEGRHIASKKALKKILGRDKYSTIKPEQLSAVHEICLSQSGYSFLRGFAGAGKTYTLGAIREIYEASGFEVVGCSLSHKAVNALNDETGMDGRTIHSLLGSLEAGNLKLSRKHVLVLDEAGMVDSRLLSKLTNAVNLSGAKMVMVGDEKQIQPIHAGQLFSELHTRFSGSQLKEVVRQFRASEGQAILKVRDGNILGTLQFYEGREGFKFLNKEVAASTKRWMALNEKQSILRPVLYGDGNLEENLDVRERLKEFGYLKGSKVIETSSGSLEIAEGEQIRFLNSSKVGSRVFRDEIAVVKKVLPESFIVEDQQGKEVKIDPREFNEFSYGYVISQRQFQDEKGFKVAPSLAEAKNELLGRWQSYIKENPDKSYLIIASTNNAVEDLNLSAREYLKKEGTLIDEVEIKAKAGNLKVAHGEQLLVTAPSKKYGLYTNDLVKVEGVKGNKIRLSKANDGHRAVYFDVNLKDFNAFKYGYAITSHKSQASTVDRSFVLVDSKFFDLEKFYVALSRSRGYSQIVVNKEILGRIPDDVQKALKGKSKEVVNRIYYSALRKQTAAMLARSGEKISTQQGVTKDQIMQMSLRDRINNLAKRLDYSKKIDDLRKSHSRDRLTELQRIAALAKRADSLPEKVSEIVAADLKRKIRKSVFRGIGL